MKIELHEITVSDLVEGYVDNHEEGIVGYGGRLNICLTPPKKFPERHDNNCRQEVSFTMHVASTSSLLPCTKGRIIL